MIISIVSFHLLYPFWLLLYWIYSFFHHRTCPLHFCPIDSRNRSEVPFLPKNCMVLSQYQLSMWFAHLLAFMNVFSYILLSWKLFNLELRDTACPPYEYLLSKIKEPPKGFLLLLLDSIFYLGHFLLISFRYMILILCYKWTKFSFQSFLQTSFDSLSEFMKFILHLPMTFTSILFHLGYTLHSLIQRLYFIIYQWMGYDRITSTKYSIFQSDGITLDSQSGTFFRLQHYAFAARMAGTDAIPFDVDSFLHVQIIDNKNLLLPNKKLDIQIQD